MRPRVPWMNETDDAILEYFAELEQSGFSPWEPPTAVWVNLVHNLETLDRTKPTVSRRMKKLASMGLLEKVDESRGYYRITELGLQYVQGDLGIEDIPRPE